MLLHGNTLKLYVDNNVDNVDKWVNKLIEIDLLAAELFLAVALGNAETVVELTAVEIEKLVAVELFLAAAEQTFVVVLEIAEIVVGLLAAELFLAAVPEHAGCVVELFVPVVLKAVG